MKTFQEGACIDKHALNVNKEEWIARKKLEKAKRKRNQRKTPYPFGFEYRRERQ